MTSIAEICRALPVSAYAPGALLIAEGARTGRLFVLVEGAVEIVKGGFQVNVVSEPGAIFGEMSVLLDMPHMADVRALSDCSAHVIENGAAFLEAHPELAFLMSQLLAQRLNGVTSYLVDLKRQFEDQSNHLGMVDEILEALLLEQRRSFTPGSDREPDY